MTKENKLQLIIYLLIMFCLGISDALRGVFAPVFQDYFKISSKELSIVITTSYLGNLIIMIFGSFLSDKFGESKMFFIAFLLWNGALAVFLGVNSYTGLLFGFFIAMGTSTLMNILLNISIPKEYKNSILIINILFFVQGIGTTFAQSYISSKATNIVSWRKTILGLMILGIILVTASLFLKEMKKTKNNPYEFNKKSTYEIGNESVSFFDMKIVLYIFIFGLYFISEHSIMNWIKLYGIENLKLSTNEASKLPTVFFLGITFGRLAFAPLINRLGAIKSIKFFLTVGTIFYILSFIYITHIKVLLALSGFLLSIIYPTLTASIQLFIDKKYKTTVTGVILSLATVFDIIFNLFFGIWIDKVGFDKSIKILPVSMLICLVLYWILFLNYKKNA